jgi:hypothetical protein
MFNHCFLLAAVICFSGLYKKPKPRLTVATLPAKARFACSVYLGRLSFLSQDITIDADVNNRAILIWVGSFCLFLKLAKPPARSPP